MKFVDRLEKDFATGNMRFGKLQGLSELNVMLLSILYLEKNPVSLEELSHKTSYSLSAVSTAMKTLEILKKVKKIKKPGDKKAYYTANRDVAGTMKEMFSNFKEASQMQLKKNLPMLYNKYSGSKDPEIKEKLKLLKEYETQLQQMEQIMDEMMKKMEDL